LQDFETPTTIDLSQHGQPAEYKNTIKQYAEIKINFLYFARSGFLHFCRIPKHLFPILPYLSPILVILEKTNINDT